MYTIPNEDGLTKWTLLETGQLINREGSDIARADMCYGYNTNEGCQKWGEAEIPTCRYPGDKFDSKPVYSNENMVYDIENSSYGISIAKLCAKVTAAALDSKTRMVMELVVSSWYQLKVLTLQAVVITYFTF